MKFNIKEKFNNFINNSKDYPVLAGFSVGFYAFTFYFSNNFDLVNSWQQILFFSFYFIVFPSLTILVIFKLLKKSNYSNFTPRIIAASIVLFGAIFIIGIPALFVSYKRIALFSFVILFILFLKIKNHKYLIVFMFLLSAMPVYKLGKIIRLNFTNSAEWQVQPDAILETKFRKTPNVYYIQPDGYASEVNLNGSLYQYDNSEFDGWLKDRKFTLYNDYRSNYESTMYSNSSCFYMKHHFSNEFSKFKYARDLIVGRNPVLEIFKKNNYKTFFITERPYLLMNRPSLYYDYCNFKSEELPHFNDGWSNFKEITNEINNQIVSNKETNNFFFIEKFKPGHIGVYKNGNLGIERERIEYIKRLKSANDWLKKIIMFIEKNDKHSIVIIGADHGGFVGFDYAIQAQNKITDRKLLNSIFGAKLAIKWNGAEHSEYDAQLKTPVNLFRILFSYLSEDKLLLNNLQPNTSYNCYDSSDFSKVYKAIDD
jgi:hypothetical protein